MNQLWLQQKVREKIIVPHKVPGTENLADALTKHVGRDILERHMLWTNQWVFGGGDNLMPRMV